MMVDDHRCHIVINIVYLSLSFCFLFSCIILSTHDALNFVFNQYCQHFCVKKIQKG